MKVATATLHSLSPLGFSKHYDTPKLNDKERPDDYEKRTWRERCHYDDKGSVFIPPMAFKKSLAAAASFLSMKIPGQGSAKYTKHFHAGILVMEPMPLPLKKEKVPGTWLFVPSDGKPGGGKRVNKCFPTVQEWEGQVRYYILDDTITQDVFERHLHEAGSFIGILFFRPERGGWWGRYEVKKVEWSEE